MPRFSKVVTLAAFIFCFVFNFLFHDIIKIVCSILAKYSCMSGSGEKKCDGSRQNNIFNISN